MMNKQDYLQELKAHNWSWGFGSTNTINKGRRKETELKALAATDPALQSLFDAYREFLFGRAPEPTIEEKAAPASSYNRQAIMTDAWAIARKAARRFGHSVKAYLPTALRQAWAKAKAKALCVLAAGTPKVVFYICIDEVLSSNTRCINQPLIDDVYTDKEQAKAALQILQGAFLRPFIKTSSQYRLH